MNFTYRNATEADRASYLDFANMVFSCAHVPHDFQALIPKVYGPDRMTAYMQHLALDEKGGVRGLVAAMPGEWRVMGKTLKTAYVGTVSVHPYARGEGHMKKLMHMTLEECRENGADLAMLSGQRQRYEYFGFTQGGVGKEHTINASNVRHALADTPWEQIEFADVAENDADVIRQAWQLHQTRPAYALRPLEDFWIICRTWNYRLVQVLKDGAFAGYLVVNDDRDRTGVSDCCLTDPADTGAVVKAWFRRKGVRTMNFHTGLYETGLNRALAAFEENAQLSHDQMLHIFRFGPVLEAFLRLKASYAPLADGSRCFEIEGETVTITVENGVPSVSDVPAGAPERLTAMEAQRRFFGLEGFEDGNGLPMGWAPLPLHLEHPDAF